MRAVDPMLRALARRVVDHELAAASRDLPAAGDRVLARLGEILSGLIGPAGLRALVLRSIHLTRAEHPWISPRDGEGEAVIALDDLRASVSREGEDGVREGIVALVANLVDLLCTFIGRGMTVRLVQRAWPLLSLQGLQLETETDR